MKFSFAVLTAAIMAVQAVALPTADAAEAIEKPPVAAQPVQAATTEQRPPHHDCPKATPVPFLRSFHASITDHFYTADAKEMQTATTIHGYGAEVDAGRVYQASDRSWATIPLYRLYSDYFKDHFYTPNPTERDDYAYQYRYTNEGVAANIFQRPICGSTPLYRMYNHSTVDHFYTTNSVEVGTAQDSGYYYEGIVGYVFP